jgi:hypothetical protein
MFNIAEIKRRAPITDVWLGLGGPPIRQRRSRAWWRNGEKPSVAIYADTGRWRDNAAGTGGDVFDLVRVVQGCGFKDAVKWLAAFAGIDLSESANRISYRPDTGWAADLRAAMCWKMAAEQLAEELLEVLPSTDPERSALTRLLAVIRVGELAMVTEFREWRRRDPAFTYAMVRAGQVHNARLQRKWCWLISERYTNAA